MTPDIGKRKQLSKLIMVNLICLFLPFQNILVAMNVSSFEEGMQIEDFEFLEEDSNDETSHSPDTFLDFLSSEETMAIEDMQASEDSMNKENITPFTNSVSLKRKRDGEKDINPKAKKKRSVTFHHFPEEYETKIGSLVDLNLVWAYQSLLFKNEINRDLFDHLIKTTIKKPKDFIQFASHHPKKIKNPLCSTPNNIYIPALEAAGLKRYEIPKIQKLIGNNVKSITEKCYTQPPTERMTFFEVTQNREKEITERNAALGIDLDDEKSLLEIEEKIWEPYFKWRKEAHERITRSEIEAKFLETVSKHYKAIDLGKNIGTFFYFSPLITLDKVDEVGRTNLQRMKENFLAPLGPDNAEMNVHHLTYHQPGYYVLLSKRLHQKFSGFLHPQKNYRRPATPDRSEFQRIKQNLIFPLLAQKLNTPREQAKASVVTK